jgi:transposase-like protein
MTSSAKSLYAGHRFPPELISYTVWLYFRFPLSLRMVEEMLPDGADPRADATRTQCNLRCHPACRSAAPDQGGLEGAAAIVIHSDAIQSR